MFVKMMHHCLYDAVYIENRLSIIFVYQLLQLLKYAQVTIHTESVSVEQILRILRCSKIFKILIILMNIGSIFFLVAVQFTNYEKNSRRKQILQLILSIFQILVFTLNLLTLCYYYQMGKFYIKEFGDLDKDVRKFKIVIWLLFFIIILSNFSENFLFSFIALMKYWNVK